jgi:hypothetical protein
MRFRRVMVFLISRASQFSPAGILTFGALFLVRKSRGKKWRCRCLRDPKDPGSQLRHRLHIRNYAGQSAGHHFTNRRQPFVPTFDYVHLAASIPPDGDSVSTGVRRQNGLTRVRSPAL